MNVIAFAAVAAAVILTGCANRPSSIAASYVSHERYSHLNCGDLQAKKNSTTSELFRVSAMQNKSANADALGVLLLGVPVSKLSGDHAANVAQLKGELQAVETAQLKANCQVEAQPLGSEKARQMYAEYGPKPWSKAFAVSTTGGAGASWGRRSIMEAQDMAIQSCAANNPVGSCFIYSVNDDVVWRPSP